MFVKDSRGSLAIPSAIGGLVMVAAIGIAFDTSRLVTERHTLQSMADAAALAAAMPEGISTQERQAIAQASLDDYMRQTGEALNVNLDGFDVSAAGERVVVTLGSQKDLVFGGVIGMNDYTVKASATAAEITGTEANAGAAILTSISFVVGYNETMMQREGQSTRIQMVKSAISSVLGAQDTDTLETSFYPFNWGTVDGNVAPLQPGVTATLQAMQYTNTREGSVPSDAVERASAEQTSNAKPTEKFVVFITDSAVENEKSDTRGQYLPDAAVVNANALTCRAMPADLVAAQNQLADRIQSVVDMQNITLGSWPYGGPYDATQLAYDPVDTIADGFKKRAILDNASAELMIGHGNGDPAKTHDPSAWQLLYSTGQLAFSAALNVVQADRRRFLAKSNAYEESCEPVQEQRVIEACEAARLDDVTIVGIDMSGDDADGTQIVQECVFGELEVDVSEADLRANRGDDAFPYEDAQLVEGLTVGDPDKYVAEDGSIYVSVSTEAELRSVLQSIMPETSASTHEATRSVRLIR